MAQAERKTDVNMIAVVIAIVGGILLLLGWIFHFPW
jgi:hypothetical protein